MRLSRLFGKTLKEIPAEADTISHQLLLRAGMVHQVTAGVYSYLPLAWRALRKIEEILRLEMDAAGGQEINMPVLQPLELWEESGRARAFGQNLFTLRDRRGRGLVLAPTHEEVVTALARRYIHSYRDLPIMVYQIQTKFRDEPRARGGLIRVRQFAMKDLYSFDADEEGLDISYQKMAQAYKKVFERCGLPTLMVEADSGAIGGKDSHEFMVIAPSGEDEVIYCEKGDYAANAERAQSVKNTQAREEPLPLEEVATPGMKTIPDLARFLGIPESRTIKALFYMADGEMVFVSIRGDLEVNEVKLKNALKCAELRLARNDEVEPAGLVAGFASPIGLKEVKIVADDSITLGSNFVVGANKPDTHLKNANYPRDFKVDLMADIARARTGDRCPRCGGQLMATRGIEVGHIFKLGTTFSQKLEAFYLDREGKQKPLMMGCYGIGLERLLAAAIEQNHDEKGILWPIPIAPYQVHLVALGMDNPEVASAAERLYGELQEQGFEVIFDDRQESPGAKFNDADLLGMPLRLTLSPRTLKAGSVEVKRRNTKEMELVPLPQLNDRLQALLKTPYSSTK
ncbi:MAG: proline--tRNA ligase [Chloroflexota bacterium]|nr:proline--tRNA ligase [Chloroflexota bacterium]